MMLSPRSDSNRRPSDYESKSLRPAGTAQTRSGCSGRRGRLLSAFLTCRVLAGGMTTRMTRLPMAGRYYASVRRRHQVGRPTTHRQVAGAVEGLRTWAQFVLPTLAAATTATRLLRWTRSSDSGQHGDSLHPGSFHPREAGLPGIEPFAALATP